MSNSGRNLNYGQSVIASGSSGSPTTASTTYVDLTDMSITLTTKGGPLMVAFVGAFAVNALAARVDVAFSLDAAAETGGQSSTEHVINNIFQIAAIYRYGSVAAGSHTIKVRWQTTAGTATASGTSRFLTVTEMPTA